MSKLSDNSKSYNILGEYKGTTAMTNQSTTKYLFLSISFHSV